MTQLDESYMTQPEYTRRELMSQLETYMTHPAETWDVKYEIHTDSQLETCTANPTWDDIFECCFKVQSSKLKRLCSLKRGKRHFRALSFELSNMTPPVGWAVWDSHWFTLIHSWRHIWDMSQLDESGWVRSHVCLSWMSHVTYMCVKGAVSHIYVSAGWVRMSQVSCMSQLVSSCPHFANFKIIWRYLSWIRMGTLELCPMWDIHGERRNLSEDDGLRKVFLVIVEFHKMSQISHQMSHLWHFQWGKWIMDYGYFSKDRPWAMSHIWMSHVAHMNESCHTYEWAMSHIWMSHVTHMNEPCHTYEWAMSHIW